ncbi:MAG TPA: GIY-YIG nuclease family protein [Methylophilaceae bacterium]|nr:GIY-YIG nuclease family protein [Methylophilaceae bacterium]
MTDSAGCSILQRMSWYLYLLECKSGAYYAGITNNLEARFEAHQQGRGARYTKANPPIRIIASRPYPDRSTASVAEAQLKRKPRHQKIDFFSKEFL